MKFDFEISAEYFVETPLLAEIFLLLGQDKYQSILNKRQQDLPLPQAAEYYYSIDRAEANADAIILNLMVAAAYDGLDNKEQAIKHYGMALDRHSWGIRDELHAYAAKRIVALAGDRVKTSELVPKSYAAVHENFTSYAFSRLDLDRKNLEFTLKKFKEAKIPTEEREEAEKVFKMIENVHGYIEDAIKIVQGQQNATSEKYECFII